MLRRAQLTQMQSACPCVSRGNGGCRLYRLLFDLSSQRPFLHRRLQQQPKVLARKTFICLRLSVCFILITLIHLESFTSRPAFVPCNVQTHFQILSVPEACHEHPQVSSIPFYYLHEPWSPSQWLHV